MEKMHVPFMDLSRQYMQVEREVQQAIQRVFTRSFFILGPEGKQFEEDFRKYIGMPYAAGVNSGTDALHIALVAAGIGRGDEVITVANTAIPTIAAIVAAGAIPIFVDIEPETCLMNVAKIEKNISAKTKALLPVHLYGNCVNMDAVMKIAQKHKLIVIEDCAQAHGAVWNKKRVGSFGDISCFSFYPTKNLGAYGDAGMILTKQEDIFKKIILLRQYGEEKRYYTVMNGFNSRLDELQAAMLSVKLKYLDQWNTRRKQIAQRYIEGIKNKSIITPVVLPPADAVYHLFVVQTENRETFQQFLQENGVSTAIHYPIPLHLQKAYESLGYKEGDLLCTEHLMKRIVSIPIFPEMKEEEIVHVIKSVNAYSL